MPEAPTPDPWTRRIHALLTKAESTQFPAEAEALLTKAQELMTRHAIDEAMLRDTARGAEDITSRVVVVDRPYAMPRAALLDAVAVASDCRLIVQGTAPDGGRQCLLVGQSTDLTQVLALFAALSLHATRCMLSAPVGAGPPRRFRHAFLLAFAARIGQRLREAREAARREVESEVGASAELVLVGRSAAVDRFVAAQFPRLRSIRGSASSASGLRHGTDAADAAILGQRAFAAARSSLPAR